MRKTRAPRSRPEVRPFSTRSCFASTLDSEGEGNPPTQRPHEHAARTISSRFINHAQWLPVVWAVGVDVEQQLARQAN